MEAKKDLTSPHPINNKVNNPDIHLLNAINFIVRFCLEPGNLDKSDPEGIASATEHFFIEQRDFDNHLNFSFDKIALLNSYYIEALLDRLGIDKVKQRRFTSDIHISFKQFLEELIAMMEDDNKKSRLKDFFKGIDYDANKKFWQRAQIAAVILFLIASIFLPIAIDNLLTIEDLMSKTAFITTLSLIYTATCSLIFGWMKKQEYDYIEVVEKYNQNVLSMMKRTLEKISDFVLLGTQASLNILAYTFVLIGRPWMLSVAPFLFVAAAFASVCKEIYLYLKYQGEETNSVYQQARFANEYQRRMNRIKTDLGIAIMTTGIIAFWCFVPGGLPVTLVAMVLLGITNVIRHQLMTRNDKIMKLELLKKFEELDGQCNEKLGDQGNNEERADVESGNAMELQPLLKERNLSTSSKQSFLKPQLRKPSKSVTERMDFNLARHL